MALNTLKCHHLTPLGLKGLSYIRALDSVLSNKSVTVRNAHRDAQQNAQQIELMEFVLESKARM